MIVFKPTVTAEQQAREKQASIELADSYRTMQQSIAWHDLTHLMEKLIADSVIEMDSAPLDTLSAQMIAKGRGIRETVDKIRRHIGYRTSQGPK